MTNIFIKMTTIFVIMTIIVYISNRRWWSNEEQGERIES